MHHLPERLPIHSQLSTRAYTQQIKNDKSAIENQSLSLPDNEQTRSHSEPEVGFWESATVS
jgi:hypothetical protein